MKIGTRFLRKRREIIDRIMKKKAIYIPNADDMIWEDLVLMKTKVRFNHLALKMLLLKQQIRAKVANEEEIKDAAQILHKFFVKNAAQPVVQRDLDALLIAGGIKNE